MSRDGSEGWAVGPGDNGESAAKTVLYHYDGLKWSRCNITPHGGEPADDACKELAPIADGKLYTIARVPLENDSNPTNDNEFQAVAVGTDGNQGAVARYDGRRWTIDDSAKNVLGHKLNDVAFTAPDDGWAVFCCDGAGSNTGLVHFDGTSWVDGFADSYTAADPSGRVAGLNSLSTEHRSLRFATAGSRIYLFATRLVGAAKDPYPMILYKDPGGNWTGGADSDLSDGYNPKDGGWDPGCYRMAPPAPGLPPACAATGQSADQGRVFAVTAAKDANDKYQGWATAKLSAGATMMRLADGAWSVWSKPAKDAAADYQVIADDNTNTVWGGPQRAVTVPNRDGGTSSFFLLDGGQPLTFDAKRQRWASLSTPLPTTTPKVSGMPAGTFAP